MSQGASALPVCLILRRLVEDYGPSEAEFIMKLGYRQIPKGLRRLRLWLDTGSGDGLLIKQISVRYPSVAVELRLAVEATRANKRVQAQADWLERCRAERPTFRPYLDVDGESNVPSSIVLFGVTGGHWNVIEIPKSILDMPLREQLYSASDLMRAYLMDFRGQVPFHGRVKGFKLVRLTDYFQFSKDAVLVGQVLSPFRRGDVEVFLD